MAIIGANATILQLAPSCPLAISAALLSFPYWAKRQAFCRCCSVTQTCWKYSCCSICLSLGLLFFKKLLFSHWPKLQHHQHSWPFQVFWLPQVPKSKQGCCLHWILLKDGTLLQLSEHLPGPSHCLMQIIKSAPCWVLFQRPLPAVCLTSSTLIAGELKTLKWGKSGVPGVEFHFKKRVASPLYTLRLGCHILSAPWKRAPSPTSKSLEEVCLFQLCQKHSSISYFLPAVLWYASPLLLTVECHLADVPFYW